MSFPSRYLFAAYTLLALGAGGCATYVAPAAKDLPDEQTALVDKLFEQYDILSVDHWYGTKPRPSHLKLMPGEHVIGLGFWGPYPDGVPVVRPGCSLVHPYYTRLAFNAVAGKHYRIESASAPRNPFWLTFWIQDLATGEKVSRVVLEDDTVFNPRNVNKPPCPFRFDAETHPTTQPQPVPVH